MILFLNFVPFNFGGGAERWMLDVSNAVNKLEEVTLVDVHSNIANIYGGLVLKRKFDKRVTIEKSTHHISLSLRSFIPFTAEWKQSRIAFQNARLIYIRYELLEILIVLYIGRISALKKTVAGIHSPFIYQNPITFFDYVHNLVYNSFLSRWFLSHMTKIHAINPLDYKLFTEKLDLKNVVHVPNFIDIKKNFSNKRKKINNNNLNIAFIGELSLRKGVDILIETIKKSPHDYIFYIAGDGPMRTEIEQFKSFQNVKYQGYLKKQAIMQLYADCDLLFVPSRAESFSLAGLEGMSYGLPLISSTNTRIGLPQFVQQINSTGKIKDYLTIFENILEKKKSGELRTQKKEIQDYTQKNFSRNNILTQLFTEIFVIKN